MSRTGIRHGTRNCYLHGCRRFECCLANSRYDRAYAERRRRGPVMVDATGNVRGHIRWLNEVHRMGVTDIARVARTHAATVHRILRGRQQLVHADLADRILAVSPCDARLVDGAETWRRIRELRAAGVPLWQIGEVCVRGYKARAADPQKWKRRWPGPNRRPFNLTRPPDGTGRARRGRIHRRNAEAIRDFYSFYFHHHLHRPTPEEERARTRGRSGDLGAAS